VDSLTAVISLTSAVVIWPLLPKLLSIPSPEQLRMVNRELQHEKASLEKAQAELRHAYAEVEQRVDERTAELMRANQALQVEIAARKQAEEHTRQLNASLEHRVAERTQELRVAQEQLLQQERLATLGQLAGSVGHELRNPLGVISNAIYFLQAAQPNAAEKIKEYLKIIEDSTRISEKIITDLLDFTRIKSFDCRAVAVSEMIQKTLERFPAPEAIQVEINLPEDLPQIYVDAQHVVQILGNLTLNAFQSMPAGGRLVISAQTRAAMVCIALEDSGIGILPENMKKIFEPLFTTKTKGIGLGLAVSQKLAETNGGRIEAHSEINKGSTFSVYLPIYKDHA
jgi:C4-dicarboxylate-specific signal transduction histidine kinase